MNCQLKKWVSALVLASLVPSLIYASPASCGNAWNCYKKGIALEKQGNYQGAVEELEYAAKSLPEQASVHSALAKAYEKVGKYQLASDHYGKQASIYKQKGADINSYLAAKRKSDELSSIVEFYEIKDSPAPNITLQKYEPAVGAYIGAFIAGEAKYSSRAYSYNDTFNLFKDFNEVTGKKHATFFDYGSIGSTVTNSFMGQEVKILESGAALHIAYEPNRGLQEVTASAIQTYAAELAALKVPIFLRYASEMNGTWVPWHGNPALYIEKWRMVHDIMKQVAPNVAMVWSPSEMPLDGMNAYYPGDAYVDWVGISIYSAQFENGDATKPTDRRNSLESVDYIYNKYASRKPIMVSEYGASHQAGFNEKKQDTSKFAKMKMIYFYESLKTKYPRVKCIQWYSRNNYTLGDPRKNKVNYSLLEGQLSGVLDTYKKIISDEYFLSNIVNGPTVNNQVTLPKQSKKVAGTLQLKGDITLGLWVKSYDPYIKEVVCKLNGQKIATLTAPYELSIPYAKLKTGKNTVEAVVFDSQGRIAKNELLVLKK